MKISATGGTVRAELFYGDSLFSTQILSADIQVGHDSKCTHNDEVNEEYLEKRRPTGQERKELFYSIEQLWYQRSYLSCVADLGQ